MNKIPTAKELINNEGYHFLNGTEGNVAQLMIDFAKLHVEAANKSKLKDVKLIWENDIIKTAYENSVWIDEDSIINAYKLDNIK
jgi:hypothetical protein